MTRKAVVTGGAGFIGTYLVERLLKNEWHVLVIDIEDLETQITRSQGSLRFLKMSVCNPEVIELIEKFNPEVVFHLAAQTSSVISEESPGIDIDSNLKGAVNIAEAVKRVNECKLVFTSSMAVYGAEFDGRVSGPGVVPTSVYGITKLASEFVFRRLLRYHKKVNILRLFNVYGPGQDLQNLKQGMLSIFSAMALVDKKICVKGSLDRTRDFVHVQDVIDQLLISVEGTADFQILEVGTGEETSVETLVSMICTLSKKLFGYEVVVEVEEGFVEDVARSCASRSISNFRELNSGLEEFLLWANKEKARL